MGNYYLFSAYLFTVLLLGLYGWSLALRKARARRELEALRKKIAGE